jgi:hypothetical protein
LPEPGARFTALHTYEVLIPLSDDFTGIMHAPEEIDNWQDETARRFNGLTMLGMVDGRWYDGARDALVRDRSHAFLVGVGEARRGALFEHVSQSAHRFGQKCIFLEERGRAYLIEPPDSGIPTIAPVLYPTSTAEPLTVAEPFQGFALYSPGRPPVSSTESVWLSGIRGRIDAQDDFLELYQDALGPASPALRGYSPASEAASRSESYRLARDWITAYGQHLGLMTALEPCAADGPRIVRESGATYNAGSKGGTRPRGSTSAFSERYVSQLVAARALGWTFDQVHQSLSCGSLEGIHREGAWLVAESAVFKRRNV